MWTDSNKRQGRDGDVPMPQVRWDLIYALIFTAMFTLSTIAGIVAWGFPFIAGLLLMLVGLGSFVCWAMGEAAPW